MLELIIIVQNIFITYLILSHENRLDFVLTKISNTLDILKDKFNTRNGGGEEVITLTKDGEDNNIEVSDDVKEYDIKEFNANTSDESDSSSDSSSQEDVIDNDNAKKFN